MTTLQAAPASPGDTTRQTLAVTGLNRRRSAPHLLLGALLVLVCAVAFAVTALRVDPRTAVLALVRAVPASHVLSADDLAVVRIVPDAALAVIAESQRSTVVGRTVRLPLAAHSLLSQDVLGPAAWPPTGQSLIAVAVKPGHAPAGITAGSQVLVLVVPASSTTTAGASSEITQAPAAVYAVEAADGGGATVVTLLMNANDATSIASAQGDAALVVRGGVG